MRKFRSILFLSSCALATAISVCLLMGILGLIVYLGAPAIGINFLTQETEDFGRGGGIFYQIIGTVLLISGAGLLSLPIALGATIYETEYLRRHFKRAAGVIIYALNGIPTILFGLFGYLVFGLYFDWGISWMTGSIILGIMILPTLMVSLKEAIESIPGEYREAAIALGLTRWGVIRSVIIPQSYFGLITGLLLGLARATGETAAIMFTATAFLGIQFPTSVFEPVTSLQTHLFILSQEAVDPVSRQNAWGTALVLVMLVLILNFGSIVLRRKISWEADR